MIKKYIITNFRETQKLGEKLAEEILKQGSKKTIVILALQGDLGGGKTTFIQGFAKGLGIKEKILSPTFVILKHFKITKPEIRNPKFETNTEYKILNTKYASFFHFDCYRIDKPEEILELGFKEIILGAKNIIAIEWPEKIKKYLPKNTIKIKFKFIDENKREIIFKM